MELTRHDASDDVAVTRLTRQLSTNWRHRDAADEHACAKGYFCVSYDSPSNVHLFCDVFGGQCAHPLVLLQFEYQSASRIRIAWQRLHRVAAWTKDGNSEEHKRKTRKGHVSNQL